MLTCKVAESIGTQAESLEGLREVLGCGGRTIKLASFVGKEQKVMMVSTQRTMVDPYMEESEEQRRPPLLAVIETTGGRVSWDQLSQMMATMIREILR